MVTKSTKPRAPAKKTSAKAASPAKLALVADSTPATEGEAAKAQAAAQVKIKDLVSRVVATSGVTNRKNVRQVVEATLEELAKALQAGEATNLPGVGRLRVVNKREDEQGLHMTLKLRRPNAKEANAEVGKEALAEVGEDS